ncbi:MAG: hypothetical protein ACYC0X_23345 [Pirellulaceae bacterium]
MVELTEGFPDMGLRLALSIALIWRISATMSLQRATAEEQAAVAPEATKPATVVVDDFSDGNFADNPPWAVQSGSFDVRDGELMFGTEADAAIHLDLGKVAWKTPLKARLKLRQTNASGEASFLFGLALTDTGSGSTHEISASPNPGYFGTSGFYDGATGGVPGAMLNGDTAPQTLEIAFDPAANSVTLRKDGVEVFRGSNRMEMPRVNRLTLKSGGTLTWLVDNVRVEFTHDNPTQAIRPGSQAVQTIYTAGAPHTDKNGRPLVQFTPDQSFLQLGIWGNPIGEVWGTHYDLKVLTEAGFNTMWPWAGTAPDDLLEHGRAAGLQVILMHAVPDDALAKVKDHPNLLGNVWMDEPTGNLWGKDMEGPFRAFLEYKAKANRLAPNMRVFINDVPWIDPPATEWWTKWNTAGDVSCHDNYPIKHSAQTRSIHAIADTVGLAVDVNHQQKPVWLIVGAFEQPGGGSFPFRFPTPMQLRACVYAGLIHGATGICYFTWDTYVGRDGNVIGMSPQPKVAYVPNPRQEGYTNPTPATPAQLIGSQALWQMAAQVNREVRELAPSILSPTVAAGTCDYEVGMGLSRTENPIHCLLKPHSDGGCVLLTVNLEDTVETARFTFSTQFAALEKLFENQPAPVLLDDGKVFQDRFEPFEVHVYRLKR